MGIAWIIDSTTDSLAMFYGKGSARWSDRRYRVRHRQWEKTTAYLPGAGLEPARTLPGPRDFKSRVSTNSTIRAQEIQ
jgi:hypothetical protein